ncbi:hypothetical protein D3OALGA1CA_839 [Olavius algarvensis associated proteobacterium Delta 3]|nr:hypothetical protein D3OALGA1CA_839 [Olavius algarvensis associated proteobacterium Delta 3]CAB5142949.1 hypothetical protein D3OALGB2SA_4343 [Olavius algarvensis associated proteobacterium Delta 3]
MATIRSEKPEDIAAIRRLIEKAFGQSAEADIVDRLRESCPETISLVAEDNSGLVGHILFSPAEILSMGTRVEGMGLAPMVVLPERQREGIGTRLVTEGLNLLQKKACPYVIVLGHPEYYPRFGFEPAAKYRIVCQWEGIPSDAFMIRIFDHSAMRDVEGIALYRDEFDDAV